MKKKFIGLVAGVTSVVMLTCGCSSIGSDADAAF